jgi:hypothetical protein
MEDTHPGLSVVGLCVFVFLSGVESAIYTRQNTDSPLKTLQKLDSQDARQRLLRLRRDTKDASQPSVLTTEVVLNGTASLPTAYVHWAGKLKSEVGSEVIHPFFSLARQLFSFIFKMPWLFGGIYSNLFLVIECSVELKSWDGMRSALYDLSMYHEFFFLIKDIDNIIAK